MFTGLVQQVGRVERVQPEGGGLHLEVDAKGLEPGRLSLGASIACNGACLTIAAYAASGVVTFFVGPETLKKTRIGFLQVGDLVNLEPALRVGDELGGHYVLGHVDGCAEISDVQPCGEATMLMVRVPSDWMQWMVPRGSIAVRGTSLTIASLDDERGVVSIMLVPHTLEHTNLSLLKAGDWVEMECDIQVKTLVQTVHKILPQVVLGVSSVVQVEQAQAERQGQNNTSVLGSLADAKSRS
jgi:riboflavin synthase